jgi:hypothetical protein
MSEWRLREWQLALLVIPMVLGASISSREGGGAVVSCFCSGVRVGYLMNAVLARFGCARPQQKCVLCSTFSVMPFCLEGRC